MAKQHHFVVIVEDGVATIDYDILEEDRDTWDTETLQWYDRNDEAVAEDYELSEQALINLLRQTWRN